MEKMDTIDTVKNTNLKVTFNFTLDTEGSWNYELKVENLRDDIQWALQNYLPETWRWLNEMNTKRQQERL